MATRPDTVSLKHTIWNTGIRTVYFYEGEAVARDGVITLPRSKPEWIQRAWVLGYQLDPKTGKSIDLATAL